MGWDKDQCWSSVGTRKCEKIECKAPEAPKCAEERKNMNANFAGCAATCSPCFKAYMEKTLTDKGCAAPVVAESEDKEETVSPATSQAEPMLLASILAMGASQLV